MVPLLVRDARLLDPASALDTRGDLLILDGGPCRVGIESTVVDVTGTTVQLLRPGLVASQAPGDGAAGGERRERPAATGEQRRNDDGSPVGVGGGLLALTKP